MFLFTDASGRLKAIAEAVTLFCCPERAYAAMFKAMEITNIISRMIDIFLCFIYDTPFMVIR